MPEQLFARPILALWLGAGALAFGSSLVFLTRDNTSTYHPDLVGPTTYSRSAIGHAAVYRMLNRLGLRVEEGGAETARADGDVLVLAEPSTDTGTLDYVKAKIAARTLLLVLPKRTGVADRTRPDRLGSDDLLSERDVQSVLSLVDPDATISRHDSVKTWTSKAAFHDPPTLSTVQLVTSTRLQPLLWADEGLLIGEVWNGDRHLILLTDPDVISNHGLAKGANAAITLQLIRAVQREPDGTVVFDEAIHGFSSVPGHSARVLFEFPFVLITIQIAIAAALLLWAGSERFGAPRASAPPLGIGARSLIEHGARLLVIDGQTDTVVDRYCDALVRHAGVQLHAPRGLDRAALIAWLSHTGRPIPSAVGRRGVATVRTAQIVHSWRRQALSGSRERSASR